MWQWEDLERGHFKRDLGRRREHGEIWGEGEGGVTRKKKPSRERMRSKKEGFRCRV